LQSISLTAFASSASGVCTSVCTNDAEKLDEVLLMSLATQLQRLSSQDRVRLAAMLTDSTSNH
jgi:hypothetical protein